MSRNKTNATPVIETPADAIAPTTNEPTVKPEPTADAIAPTTNEPTVKPEPTADECEILKLHGLRGDAESLEYFNSLDTNKRNQLRAKRVVQSIHAAFIGGASPDDISGKILAQSIESAFKAAAKPYIKAAMKAGKGETVAGYASIRTGHLMSNAAEILDAIAGEILHLSSVLAENANTDLRSFTARKEVAEICNDCVPTADAIIRTAFGLVVKGTDFTKLCKKIGRID